MVQKVSGFRGVLVSTSARYTEGTQFKPWLKQFLFVFSFWPAETAQNSKPFGGKIDNVESLLIMSVHICSAKKS